MPIVIGLFSSEEMSKKNLGAGIPNMGTNVRKKNIFNSSRTTSLRSNHGARTRKSVGSHFGLEHGRIVSFETSWQKDQHDENAGKDTLEASSASR